MTVAEQIEILQAYERGEEIEHRLPCYEWYTLASKEEYIKKIGHEYQFNFLNNEYRIKKLGWRAEERGGYFYIDERLSVRKSYDTRSEMDESLYISGNYFRTKECAEQARDFIKKHLTKFKKENDN